MKIKNQLIARFFILFFMSALLGCVAQVYSEPDTETTIIMIRHAQKNAITKQLTERGHHNAKALVDIVGDMNITALYSPNKTRNLQTVAPLAKHLNIEISIVPKDEIPENTMDKAESLVKKILGKHPGETILWVGNTSNLGQIYWTLGGDGDAPESYGDLFILTVPDQGKTKVVKKIWGAN
ncbi:MAG: histidine phosphatase family protein [Gammaproteobacteria bacterium]|nr:histidine phosphatase family protein [Gammaproteobacteria bacterium]